MNKKVSTPKILLTICILFTLISPIMANSRKYDLEAESMKLYGEDFRSVLRRFRRTPDYLKILNDKMNDLKVYLREMSLQVLHYYHIKMTQRVGDIVGVTHTPEETTPATTPVSYYRGFNPRRQENEEDINKAAIKHLDNYKAFNYALTVPERNSFKDLGFEFAGNLIHTIIHNMGPDEPPIKSTRQPNGGIESDKKTSSTTEHPHTHEVTADTTQNGNKGNGVEVTPGDPDATTETFRFRSNWKRVEKFFSKWESLN